MVFSSNCKGKNSSPLHYSLWKMTLPCVVSADSMLGAFVEFLGGSAEGSIHYVDQEKDRMSHLLTIREHA